MFGRLGEVMGGFECFDTSLSGPLWRCDRHFYLRLWNISLCHTFFGWSFMWKWLLRKSSPKLLEEFEHISVREILCWFQSKVNAIEQTLLNGDRGKGWGGGGGYSLKRWGKLFSRLFFGDSTITHMQIFHSHVNIIINLSSTLFWNIPSVSQLLRLKRRFTVRFSTTMQNNFCFYLALICFCFTVSPKRLSRFDLSCPLADSPKKEENEDRLQIQTPHFHLLPFNFVVEKLSKLQKKKKKKKDFSKVAYWEMINKCNAVFIGRSILPAISRGFFNSVILWRAGPQG